MLAEETLFRVCVRVETMKIPMLHILSSLNLYAMGKSKSYCEINLPSHSLLEKIRNLFSGQPQKEEPLVKLTAKKGKSPSGCPHHFGYLTNRPKNAHIPQKCLICQKILECMRG